MKSKKSYRKSGRFKEILDVLQKAKKSRSNFLWRSQKRQPIAIVINQIHPEENTVEISATDGDEVDRHLRPAITLISAWISEVARIEHVDTALLATRNDIVAYLRRDTDARLATGWRLDLIGEQLDDLLQGKAGLSFDGKGGLKMISAVPNVEPVGTKSA